MWRTTLFKLFRRKKKEDEVDDPVATAPVEVTEESGAEAPVLATMAAPATVHPPVSAPVSVPPIIWQEEAVAPGLSPETDDGETGYDDAEVAQQTAVAVERTKRTWFGRIASVFSREQIDEDLWDELEELLISADTGVETTEEIITYVKGVVARDGITNPAEAREILKDEMEDILLAVDKRGRLWGSESTGVSAPAVILVVGVNGVGKTTSIAKLAHLFTRDGEKVLLAAADTFRAAAIDQLKMWGDRTGVEVIAGKPGSDPGAVVYDAMEAAKARGSDVVIVDTAGRLHTKHNLMQELGKIRKVLEGRDPSAPHEVLLVVDATTGQNGLTQAQAFTEVADVTAICLTKLDGTAKGGIVFSICSRLGTPVRFIGTGEKATDMAPFDPRRFVESLFSSSSTSH